MFESYGVGIVTIIEEIATKNMLELFKKWAILMEVLAGYGENNPGCLASTWIGSPLHVHHGYGMYKNAFYETHRAPDM